MTDHRKLDRNLDTLLRQGGARVDLVGAREIIRGLLATPAAADDAALLSLVAPKADTELQNALFNLRERIANTFDDDGLARRKTDPKRLEAVRDELKKQDLDGFLVPKADQHQGEFIAKSAERLQWVTGFTGSAGSGVVMAKDKAAIFVDGRYTLQVKTQVSAKSFERHHSADKSLLTWLKENLSAGQRLGFDPWLHTEAERLRLEQVCNETSARLIAVEQNPVDAAWAAQPPAPLAPVVVQTTKFTGETGAKRRQKMAAALEAANLDAVVLTQPESVAWLLNVRGRDIPCTPVALGFAILHKSGAVEWFTDPRKLQVDVAKHLGEEVIVLEPDGFATELTHLGRRGARVGVDTQSAAAKIALTLQNAGADAVAFTDPTALPRATKTQAEQDGMRKAHLRDGIALAQFLAWLDREGGKGKITEWDVGEKIDDLRRELDLHQGPSFQTIAGFGPNGAIVHYRAAEKGCATLKKGSLLLVDSGGQFLDGTTDVTRTVAIGKPTAEMRDRYTRVLKGHIALARAIFPEGTRGVQLDLLARKPLWDVGLDYDHGTGHGVGSYLGVHEGPQRISKHPSGMALVPGMVVSNEPGYYKIKAYGIRIENLIMVKTIKRQKGYERALLGFETLTCAPYDQRLIEPKLLCVEEVAWLNDYHAWVKKTLIKSVDKTTGKWLTTATKAIKKPR